MASCKGCYFVKGSNCTWEKNPNSLLKGNIAYSQAEILNFTSEYSLQLSDFSSERFPNWDMTPWLQEREEL